MSTFEVADAAAAADRATVAAQAAEERAAAAEVEVQALRWELEALRRASAQTQPQACTCHLAPSYSSDWRLSRLCDLRQESHTQPERSVGLPSSYELYMKLPNMASFEESDNTEQHPQQPKDIEDHPVGLKVPVPSPGIIEKPASPPEDNAVLKRSRTAMFYEPKAEEAPARSGPKAALFGDVSAMKEKVRQTLLKPKYDVSNFYKKYGLFRKIATHNIFDKGTLVVIAFNALWIGIDCDYNDGDVLLRAKPVFQLAEHFFCFYFCFEWFVRFMSFEEKSNCLRDSWFVFDSALVCMMFMETWLLTLIMILAGTSGGSVLGDVGIVRIARLARLTRMARMARLLRSMPELMILIKGMFTGTRSVFFTLCLLTLVIYVFAIGFSQMLSESPAGQKYFSNVPHAMYTLMVFGTLMDNTGIVANALGSESLLGAAMFFFFVLLAALTVMNMLIGVLCEVVSAVAATEKESLTVAFVTTKLQSVLDSLDEDGDGSISQAEFAQVLESFDATSALQEVGVDVIGLVDFADFIFQGDVDENGNTSEKKLSFEEFMNVVLQFRGSNTATVKDIVDLRKFITTSIARTNSQVAEVKHLVNSDLKQKKNIDQSDLGNILRVVKPDSPNGASDVTEPWGGSSRESLAQSSSSKMKFGYGMNEEDCANGRFGGGHSSVLL
eukprot:TRINITY_DN34068_c1_g2_i1.p1 TRINITY_DN34068_c1_g2~~TRINITY_DN34068_c1_g2_i1.p1  ORF type:complete len:749 (-),score=124.82 TRINITY_DN34068_c1_g2_i1:244-2250(-)